MILSIRLGNTLKSTCGIWLMQGVAARTAIMREAIAQYVEREEKREALRQDAMQAWEDYQRTAEKMMSCAPSHTMMRYAMVTVSSVLSKIIARML